MKEFDYYAAKNGKRVMTRDGRNVRIVCFDRKDEIRPIIALVANKNGGEDPVFYGPSGKCAPNEPGTDLVMATEKRVGWVNIYTEPGGDRNAIGVYPNEHEAKEDACKFEEKAVATVKIEWEE